ncbi:MAG: hypothetical protein ACRBCI_04540 [Cellvibrionaceae bacterium]
MIKPLLVVIAIAGLFYFIRYIKQQPAEKRPKIFLKYGLYLLAFVLIILVVTGKLHWLAAGIAALLPIAQKLFFLALRVMPFLQNWRKKKQSHNAKQPTEANFSNMTIAQAKEIFGFDEINSIEQITKRHKELMQKNHPDRGGSDYLAAQINQAKDKLIEHIKHSKN